MDIAKADRAWRLADLQKISAGLWLALVVCQIGLALEIPATVMFLCALYNVFAGVRRLSTVYRIEARDPSIPDEFCGVLLLIILAVVNLWIGGYIGVLLVAFDFYIRSQVLGARELFDGGASVSPIPSSPPIDRLDLLRRLGVLRDGGVLSEVEFVAEKAQISQERAFS